MLLHYNAIARAMLGRTCTNTLTDEVSYEKRSYLLSRIGTGIMRIATQPTSVDAQRGFRARNNGVEKSGKTAPNMLRMTVHAPSADAAAYA